MITRISAVNPNVKMHTAQKTASKTNVQAQSAKNIALSGANFSSMYQAMNGIQTAKTVSFGALTELEYQTC